MRISDSMLRQNSLRDLQDRLATAALAQRQSATGLRVSSMADAPSDAAQIMRLDSQAGGIIQFRRTATLAATRLGVESDVVKSARDLMQQAKGLARSVVNTDPGDPLRQAVDAQLSIIHEQLVSLGNTQVGNEYIFGGARTDTPPFLSDGTYVGDQTVRRAAIDTNTTVDTNHVGDDLLGSSLTALTALQIQVNGGSSGQVQASMSGLDAAARELLTHEAEVGARLNSVNLANQSLGARSAQILNVRDSLANVDQAEAAVNVVTTQNALEQAYAVVGRILGSSLLKYLP